MAIEIQSVPMGTVDAGIFNLPPEFDTKQFAAEWVEKGQVAMKQQRQNLPQTGMSADGWQVWKKDSKDKPTTTHGSGNKEFVLMCRPRIIQDQVNALYGNVSKKLLNSEVAGKTNMAASATPPAQGRPAGGVQMQDPGMVSEDSALGRNKAEIEESTFPLNDANHVTAAQST